ncbi:hypothetical protein C1H46_007558 [Malus baccata]|uniref:Protein kinase domain-containing protein n=1 Tax=Malus baccata TaxID=106549 RepID=A0A540N707_MALBA|nr:hypothetical protein C1H46_007558 [Malus baccata]
MLISDTGGTVRMFFTLNVQIKDARSSKFLVCNGEVIKNGTIVHLKLGFHELICDKGGTISQRLFNSKSKNTDCALGFDCSKVVKCEVSFDYSMIINGEYAGNLRLHHLEARMDKNRKHERKFTLSRFGNGCCVVCCVVLDRDYCKGIRDKGGGSKFRITNVINAPLRPSSMTNSLRCSSLKRGDKTRSFHLAELSTATKHFSTESIGAGSFGIVYKGKLSDGRETTIKRRDTRTNAKKFQGKESAIDSELALMSRFHHEHLVKLVGSCAVNNEWLLVCEYMSNGSLHDHLHVKNNVE